MKQTQKKVAEQIEYATWENMIYDSMTELFMNYMVAQTAFPEEKNVGLSPHSYFYENGYVIVTKIDKYIDDLKNKVADYQIIYDSFVCGFHDPPAFLTRGCCFRSLYTKLSPFPEKNIGKGLFWVTVSFHAK